MQKTGIELITEERKEQIEKHGWTLEHDIEHTGGALSDAAVYLLTKDSKFFPSNWNHKYWVKFEAKEGIEALKVAGALIAAEIDRLNAIE